MVNKEQSSSEIDLNKDKIVESAPRKLRRWGLILFFWIVLVPILGLAGYTWLSLHFRYSVGERAGYLQKISKKGWLCKTWEGELAMVNLPGAVPEVFRFSLRDEKVANDIAQALGQRVTLTYDEHRGVPTTCFGETSYFVTGIQRMSP